jgi:cobalt-zinc-cadmium resistance protein CzcA
MEIGLYPTPGGANICSTSFYGLTFVRVTFQWGIDYHFAYTQANLSLQQNVSLPGGQVPQIQQSSLVGEVYRYQVVGPPNFGLTDLRTVRDWIAILLIGPIMLLVVVPVLRMMFLRGDGASPQAPAEAREPSSAEA